MKLHRSGLCAWQPSHSGQGSFLHCLAFYSRTNALSSNRVSHPAITAQPRLQSSFRSFTAAPYRRYLIYVWEILLVALWAAYVGRDFLGTNRLQLNSGGDNVSAYGRFFWDRLASCGTCALWSGQVNGGAPAYIDSNSDVFHPAVAIPALMFGTLQSFKLTIVICLFMGGLACWWLALELGTGFLARVVAGFMGAAGGYLAGTLVPGSRRGADIGRGGGVRRTGAFASSANSQSAKCGSARDRTGAVCSCCRQGYLQIGFIMMAPIFLILMTGVWNQWRLYLTRAAQALVIGLLIPATFLFPFLRYYSDFSKPSDPAFLSHQPLHYLVLNLVINDWDYMRTDRLLGKQSLPGLY